MDLEVLYYKRRQLETLQNDINEIISHLNNVIVSLDGVPSLLDRNYQINGNPANASNLNRMFTEVINKRNYLKDNVLVSVINELKKINDTIASGAIFGDFSVSSRFV